MWNVEQGREMTTDEQYAALAPNEFWFTPDAARQIGGGDDGIRLYEVWRGGRVVFQGTDDQAAGRAFWGEDVHDTRDHMLDAMRYAASAPWTVLPYRPTRWQRLLALARRVWRWWWS